MSTKRMMESMQRSLGLSIGRRAGALAALAGAMLMATAGAAGADDDLRLGVPVSGGTGCPSGTVAASVSPDGKELSILFDQFVVEAGASVGRRLDRKSCNISIPVQVPQGYSVAIFNVDYRGFNALPRGTRSQLTADYFFAGQTGPRSTRAFTGPQDRDYLVNDRLLASALVWSACGDSVNFRINTSLLVQSPNGADAMATLDSTDLSAGIVYQLQWRRCGGRGFDDGFGYGYGT